MKRLGSTLAPPYPKRPSFKKKGGSANVGIPEPLTTTPPVVVDLGNSPPNKGDSSAAKIIGENAPDGVEGEASKASNLDAKETSAKAAVETELAADAADAVTEEIAGKRMVPLLQKEVLTLMRRRRCPDLHLLLRRQPQVKCLEQDVLYMTINCVVIFSFACLVQGGLILSG